MKCGIVTVYNSENCGSFLQGYALAQFLKGCGHEAVFIRQNFGDHSASRRNYLIKQVKTALRGNFHGVKLLATRRALFKQAIAQHLQVVENADGLDCCVLGSDVIWDVTGGLFRNHHSFFWGSQFYPTRVISYAASVGFAKAEDLARQSFVRDSLQKMAAVSVRDVASQELLRPYTDKPIHLVCDPTYLIGREAYDAIAKPTDLEKILFLYCYGDLPAEDRAAIQKLAAQEGLKTLTFGTFNKWCDISLPYDPLLFLSIYDKADYIVTNTFHGTVFSTIYEKRFAVVKNDKQKVINVLKMCGLSDKMTQTPGDYAAVLHGDFDYEASRRNIARERENSLRYLSEALGGRNANG